MTVDEIMQNDLKQVERDAELRRKNVVGIHLSACLERVPTVADDIAFIMENAKSTKALWNRLSELVSAVIVESAGGRLTVTNYVQKQMSKQQVYVFVDTHWMTARTQVFYDFVKDGAKKAGLSDTFCEDPKFMNQLFEQVAFRVARDREQYVPQGEVWVNLQNGTLEVYTKGGTTFREHRREDFFTYVLPYSYAPKADCPQWHAFLDEVLPEAEEQTLLGEYIGYCFTRHLKLEKMAVLYGGGANGKSVTTDVITELLGHANVSHVDLEKLTTDDNHRSQAVGMLANISQENGPNIAYSTLKNMVSGEAVMVKLLYNDPYPTDNYGKIFASYNTLPKTENTLGFYRRWLLFYFGVTIAEDKRDVHLKDKLCQELPGILNWSLKCLEGVLGRNGFTQSKACNEALEAYKNDSNSALRFFFDRCVLDEDGRLTGKELYAEYQNFCRDEVITNRFGKNNFLKQLALVGAMSNRTTDSRFYNVKFKSEY